MIFFIFAAPDFRDDLEDNQVESAIDIFNKFSNRAEVTVKKEPLDSNEQSSVEPSEPLTFHNLKSLQSADPDELFLAMILPDIKKLSAQKKRKVKMEVQRLLDEALTEEDQ